jgi:hypothetical protein
MHATRASSCTAPRRPGTHLQPRQADCANGRALVVVLCCSPVVCTREPSTAASRTRSAAAASSSSPPQDCPPGRRTPPSPRRSRSNPAIKRRRSSRRKVRELEAVVGAAEGGGHGDRRLPELSRAELLECSGTYHWVRSCAPAIENYLAVSVYLGATYLFSRSYCDDIYI